MREKHLSGPATTRHNPGGPRTNSLMLTDHYGYDKATHEISSPPAVLPILFFCFQALD